VFTGKAWEGLKIKLHENSNGVIVHLSDNRDKNEAKMMGTKLG